MASFSPCYCTHKYMIVILLLVFSMYSQKGKYCNAFQTFGFEMHHRFSDQVKSMMDGDNLPETGTREYHAAVAYRDKFFRSRALAENDDDDSRLLTLSDGIESYTRNLKITSLGTLHYASVSLGTPSITYLVALDTGTNLLWLPCDVCANCAPVATSLIGEKDLEVYSSKSSLTSKVVPCSSSLCEIQSGCSKPSSQCPYKVTYNNNSTSSGVLVKDVLHLKTFNHRSNDIDANITFGCGKTQTGLYLNGTARCGLFGLGIGNTSVPSILSSQRLVADSFSICFGIDGVGKIIFGDKGSSGQAETPFNIRKESPSYNITITQLSVGENISDLTDVTAIFYSDTEYTYLNDPAYTALCDSFDSQIRQKGLTSNPKEGFKYCYDVSPDIPNVTLIMKGGSQFNVYNPMIRTITNGMISYCLGVVKATAENFIGNNFMTGHNIVFDRENMVMGWKPANNCTAEIVDPNTQPDIPQNPTFGNSGTPKNGLNSNKAPHI
ncbi:hypothetical protein MKW98_024567 [Papaver atlanticum]|uniref:Peptidase A1 domain-containing protein n=1 Tax=Papaver atlanticum TaxID=357466 RepID=A0AAD4XAH1_9MAGN|nr:hypothetical protein MKW98_024567 [Papaver atlanticum]